MIAFATLRHAEVGDHEKVGFSGFAYGMAEVGLWKATAILAEQFKSDPRHILINSVCLCGVTQCDAKLTMK